MDNGAVSYVTIHVQNIGLRFDHGSIHERAGR
jgi:hypothetical protein